VQDVTGKSWVKGTQELSVLFLQPPMNLKQFQNEKKEEKKKKIK
jgi:hypothetical protein